MIEAWYVACDVQMFFISPLFIYPLWRWKRAGIALGMFSIALFIGLNAAVHFFLDLPPTVMPTRP